MTVVPAAIVWFAVEFYLISGRFVTVENAYVKSDIVNISSNVTGRVINVLVDDHDLVGPGDPLLQIDPEPFRGAISAAEAEIFAIRQHFDALRERFRLGEALIRNAEEEVRVLEDAYKTQELLFEDGTGLRVRRDDALLALKEARRALTERQERNAIILIDLGGNPDTPLAGQPAYKNALINLEAAQLDLSHTIVQSPAHGILTQVNVEVGEYLTAGKPILALVDTHDRWVEANLKEVDLTHIEIGQPATIVADAFPEESLIAHVESISPATGAEFALLPPQNSTGNWVKVVQRIPVRLRFDQTQDISHLRSGMTVTVSIDTGRERTFGGLVESVLADVLPGE